ncbi:peroxidase, partial [Streptosporangium sp. NPDC049248]
MSDPRISRRGLLAGGAVTAAGALAACAPDQAVPAAAPRPARAVPVPVSGGSAVEPFDGAHQAGIATMPQAYGVFVGLDLLPGTDREALGRMMRLLTDD